ncbi:hypothetical protein CO058_03405 [candidate division WWE3 bacterium CG_4_9_14_0_2_um_filter_35_11]|uniref:Dipeptidylpeptidase IV N-terminal domain-containing protein n=1 Tax=candidate division WWE3 bacterium CG_4_9_14_0_2_um_filter_35_11 TaxID=1975077 RepID=A0A2M8EL34_UNCKA|nr:MAG: hypothetical protein COV25_00800 [candidate division WWE3 bacterium CG10_big_fil_rev_8_21_14_0_10_35_32]PJC23454.1 MAG: hypothetical protein CO058_03405 [candidate division WWE3 bacterium CG_4_9_14_0_2_um_filter_35_11]
METPVQTSEFAEKKPLFEKSFYRKLFKGLFFFFGLIAIGIGIVIFIASQKKPIVPEDPTPTPEIQPEKTVRKEIKYLFAYIKNGTSIFALEDNFQEKILISEIPVSADGIYTTLAWKEPAILTYSKCLTQGNACELFSYDIKNNSLKPELVSTASKINAFEWSPDRKYIAYISEEGNATNLRFKSGTIDTQLRAIPLVSDSTNTYAKVLFSDDGQYFVFSTLMQTQVAEKVQANTYPAVYIYRINGIQNDLISGASDPFFVDNQIIGYKKDGKLLYKAIGEEGESEITNFIGYNPQVSPNGKSFAYWWNENNDLTVVLGVYDSKLNIHRNILRGIILPTWITQDKIAGIKADSCLGESCLLYQFQTASLAIVDILNGEVTPVDQAKSISNITFNRAN